MRPFWVFVSVCGVALAFVLLLANPSSAATPQSFGDVAPSVSTDLNPAFEHVPLLGTQVRPVEDLIQVAKRNKRKKKRRKWRKIRRAIGAAIVTGIVVNEISRSSRGRYRGRGQCYRWQRSCDRGYEEACRAFYRNCD